MPTVTFKGPTEGQSASPTSSYWVGDTRLRLNQPVEVDDEVVEQLKATEGYEFEFGESGEPEQQSQPPTTRRPKT